jgi:hypothetical protein
LLLSLPSSPFYLLTDWPTGPHFLSSSSSSTVLSTYHDCHQWNGFDLVFSACF